MRILAVQGAKSQDCRQALKRMEETFYEMDDRNVMINGLDQERSEILSLEAELYWF